EQYTLDKLTGDIAGLLDALGYADAYIVGHDWGAMVAWSIGIYHPTRVRKLAVMNVPHPVVFQRTVRGNWRQTLKSWYIGFFQIPALPEFMLSLGGYSVAANAIKGSAKPTAGRGDHRYAQLVSRHRAEAAPEGRQCAPDHANPAHLGQKRCRAVG
ncbi:MAG: alpha/beta hydrolase, partial [Anaerolineae bacterium]|nr:alpha/beta hydrolase [Anaerolineae bacterium]